MPQTIDQLLASYPRVRQPLPPKLAEIYHETYVRSREGRSFLYGITQRLEGWMHQQVARSARPDQRVLELGAGTLNHLRWEPAAAAYDVVEPYTALFEGRPELARVSTVYDDIAAIPRDARYDRVISIATLEHVLDLPILVAEAAARLAPDGVFVAGIPSEGGLLWGLAWRMSVGLAFKLRTGQKYGDLMRHEHVSTAREITAVVSHFFEQLRIRRFPTPLIHGSLYTFLECRRPRVDVANDWLRTRQSVAHL